MVTKTLTITEEAYNVLKGNKLREESFSQGIIRLLKQKKKKKLLDFFGIISEEEGATMLEDFESIKQQNIRLLKERLKNENC